MRTEVVNRASRTLSPLKCRRIDMSGDVMVGLARKGESSYSPPPPLLLSVCPSSKKRRVSQASSVAMLADAKLVSW